MSLTHKIACVNQSDSTTLREGGAEHRVDSGLVQPPLPCLTFLYALNKNFCGSRFQLNEVAARRSRHIAVCQGPPGARPIPPRRH